jgi:hypothetical protein
MLAGHEAAYDCIRAFSETDLTDDLKRFDVPTLILHGDDDQIVPIGASASLSSKIVKGAKLVVYAGAPLSFRTFMNESILNTPLTALRGRSLLSSRSELTAAGLIDAPFVASTLGSSRSLGRLAVQTPSAEGTWSSPKVEGAVPQEPSGDLYLEGKATVSARFIGTPEHEDEQRPAACCIASSGLSHRRRQKGERTSRAST